MTLSPDVPPAMATTQKFTLTFLLLPACTAVVGEGTWGLPGRGANSVHLD